MRSFVIILSIAAAISVATAVAWTNSGRDLSSLSDGLSHDFRIDGQRAFDSPNEIAIGAAIVSAKRHVRTKRDAEVFALLSSYDQWLARSLKYQTDANTEMNDLKIHSIGDPGYALRVGPSSMKLVTMELDNAKSYLANAGDCWQDLSRVFPYSSRLGEDTVKDPFPHTGAACKSLVL